MCLKFEVDFIRKEEVHKLNWACLSLARQTFIPSLWMWQQTLLSTRKFQPAVGHFMWQLFLISDLPATRGKVQTGTGESVITPCHYYVRLVWFAAHWQQVFIPGVWERRRPRTERCGMLTHYSLNMLDPRMSDSRGNQIVATATDFSQDSSKGQGWVPVNKCTLRSNELEFNWTLLIMRFNKVKPLVKCSCVLNIICCRPGFLITDPTSGYVHAVQKKNTVKELLKLKRQVYEQVFQHGHGYDKASLR